MPPAQHRDRLDPHDNLINDYHDDVEHLDQHEHADHDHDHHQRNHADPDGYYFYDGWRGAWRWHYDDDNNNQR